jgi:pyruvate dehydrogenase E1 component beta subunit
MTLVLALRRAHSLALATYPEALVVGADVGAHGGPYHATLGLRDTYGPSRVIDLPRNPTAAFGVARGLALAGHRVICELPREDAARMASALAQDIVAWSHLADATVTASWGRLAGSSPDPDGRWPAEQPPAAVGPIVLRVPFARDADLAPWFDAAGPGVHVLVPSTPDDAFFAVTAGVSASGGLVVVLEAESLYRSGADAAASWETAGLDPAGPDAVGHSHADEASDLFILAAGEGALHARSAAQSLVREGFKVAVHDLRVLSPLDVDGLSERVARSGRAVIHVDAGPLGQRLAAALSARAFLSLEAPLRAVPVSSGPASLLAACRETLDF